MATRFTVVYSNGAVVDNAYNGQPIILNCTTSPSSGSSASLIGADTLAQLRMLGINFQSSQSVWAGSITGLQVAQCFCHLPVTTTTSSSTSTTVTTPTTSTTSTTSTTPTTTTTAAVTCGSNCSPASLVSTTSTNPAEYAVSTSGTCLNVVYTCRIGDTISVVFMGGAITWTGTYNGNGVSVYCDGSGNLRSVSAFTSPTVSAGTIVNAVTCTPGTPTTTSTTTTSTATTATTGTTGTTTTIGMCPYMTSSCVLLASSVINQYVEQSTGTNVLNGCPLLFLTCPVGYAYTATTSGGIVTGVIPSAQVAFVANCIGNVWVAPSNGGTLMGFTCALATTTTSTTTTTTTTTTTPKCSTCTPGALNYRNDNRTIVSNLTVLMSGCLQVTVSCTCPTGLCRYNVIYNTTASTDQPYTSALTFNCDANGQWADPTFGNLDVSQLFCYDVTTASDVVTCTGTRTSPIAQVASNPLDVSVPLYNRTTSSPQICSTSASVGATQFQCTNFSTPLLTLAAAATPSFPGLIGTAQCPAGQSLCFCGYVVSQSITPNCYYGNGSIYLVDYLNATSNQCYVDAIPVANSFFAGPVYNDHVLGPISQLQSTNGLDLWTIAYPQLTYISCVPTSNIGANQCLSVEVAFSNG